MPIEVNLAPRMQTADTVDRFVRERVASRLAASDPTLWGADSAERASHRLGWVDAIGRVAQVIEKAQALAASIEHLHIDRVFLCGMGGSSLAPRVMSQNSRIPLIAVDTHHPDRVFELFDGNSLSSAVVVVSSKSGATSETRAQLAYVEARFHDLGIDPADRIIVITDPDSDLAKLATRRGYRLILADPTVGGRYAALIEFGIVPAVLADADMTGIADDAIATLDLCSVDDVTNPMLQVSAALAEQALSATTAQFTEVGLPLLPRWIEQLIAESTGHDGQGLLPLPRAVDHLTSVAGPTVILADAVAPVRIIDAADLTVRGSLASQFVFWELVTAAMAVVLGVNPFEQPDVERTKEAARKLRPEDLPAADDRELAAGLRLLPTTTASAGSLESFIDTVVDEASKATYVVIQAFTIDEYDALQTFAERLEAISSRPVTVSYGPQYLHSTGQLHKGGPAGGFFISILEVASKSLGVPGMNTTFEWLHEASARADLRVLQELGRPGVSLRINDEAALTSLVDALASRGR